MNGLKTLTLMLAAASFALPATPAQARRASREGLNFGTTVRLLDNDERTIAGLGSDKNTKMESSSQAVNPYIAYAFESLNIGLMASVESKASRLEEQSEDGSEKTTRTTDVDGKGGSLFARFLFGNVFFFVGGVGLYQEKQKVSIETKRSVDGSEGEFTGDLDEYQVEGIGPGYHVGGGLELPMGAGFFFSTAYQVRTVQLRDHAGGSELGRKRSQQQKREVLFGISHYTK
jgi:hypothetical protein